MAPIGQMEEPQNGAWGLPQLSRRSLLKAMAGGLVLTVSPTGRQALASVSPTSTQMGPLDLMLAAHRDLGAVDTTGAEASLWSGLTGVKSFQALHAPDGSIAAYHLAFAPAGYAVVNNNRLNPVVLEYSTIDHPAPEALSTQFLLPPPGGSSDETGRDPGDELPVPSYASVLSAADPAAARLHSYERAILQSSIQLRSHESSSLDGAPTMNTLSSSYGFLDPSGLPKQSYSGKILSGTTSVSKWGTTGEFKGVNGAKDHCGATAAFNVVNYYRTRYARASLMLSTRKATFTALHKHIGNGPVTFIGLTGGLKKYVEARKSSITRTSNGGYGNIRTALSSNKMVVILLAAGLFKMHFVCGVGWREYSGGSKFIRVVDGWNDTSDRFIRSNNLVGSYVTHIT